MAELQSQMPEFLTTREVAELLRVKERKIYELAADGGIPCRRITGKLLFPRAEIKDWMAQAKSVHQDQAVKLPNILAGSHDPLLDWAIRESACGIATLFDGSLDGLERMTKGDALAAAIHIYEPGDSEESENWNMQTVAASALASSSVLVAWAVRQQGLILASNAAGSIRSPGDLRGKRVVRRQSTSGSQLLLEHLLTIEGVAEHELLPVSDIIRTESDVAALVASGKADAAPGLKSVADQFGLAFLPTLKERFDLLVNRKSWFDPPFQKFLSFCYTAGFAKKAAELGGYDISELGRVRWNGD
jgi:putative molybdopterin biosynthesis protein